MSAERHSWDICEKIVYREKPNLTESCPMSQTLPEKAQVEVL